MLKAILSCYRISKFEDMMQLIDGDLHFMSSTLSRLKTALGHPDHRAGKAPMMEYKAATLFEFIRYMIGMFPYVAINFLELGLIKQLKIALQFDETIFAKDVNEASKCIDTVITDLFQIEKIQLGLLY